MLNPRTRSSLLAALFFILLHAPLAGAQPVVEEVVGLDGEAGQDGEDAEASGELILPGAEPVDFEVRARGGSGGPSTPAGDPAGSGGDATLGEAYGASESGEVRVLGHAEAGYGGEGLNGASAGDGGTVHLRGAVDGDTEGRLELIQRAIGGDAGVGTGGFGGAASSHLTRSKSAEELVLRSEAQAGGRALSVVNGTFKSSDFGGPGASASASSHAFNDAGPASAFVISGGGSGGVEAAGGPAMPGGDAHAWTTATTQRDGQAVEVGAPLPDPAPFQLQPVLSAALGGPGASYRAVRGTLGGSPDSDARATTPNLPGGDGGNASSFSMGTARGRSPVDVHDTAIGGFAGSQIATWSTLGARPGFEYYEDVGAGVGGDAHSVAVGLGGRGEPIRAVSHARGGRASNIVEITPAGPVDCQDGSGLSNQFTPIVGERELPLPVPCGDGSGLPNQIGRRDIRWLGEFGESGGAARARAQAFGSGPVEVGARAEGGGGSLWFGDGAHSRHAGGPAHAEASGAGRGGSARALAASNSAITGVKVGATQEVVHAARVTAKIAPNALAAPRGRRRGHQSADASARAVVDPTREATDAALAHAQQVVAELAETAEPLRPAFGRWNARHRQWTWRKDLTTTLSLELRTERSLYDDPIERYRVVLLSPELRSWGFGSLRVTLEKEGVLLVDETFDDAAEARAWLDGQVLEVGTLGGVDLPSGFPAAAPANLTISTGEVVFTPETGGNIVVGGGIGEVLGFRRSEVAVLTLELVTRRPGAGLQLDFLVSTTPLAVPE